MNLSAPASRPTSHQRPAISVKQVSGPRNHLDLLGSSPAIAAGLSCLGGLAEGEDSSEVALDLDPQIAVFGNKADHLDEGADRIERLGAGSWIAKRLIKRCNFLPVNLGEVGMDEWRGCRRDGERARELGLPRFRRLQLVLQRLDGRVVLGDEFDQLADTPFDPSELGTLRLERSILLGAKPVELAMELGAELLEERGVYEPMAKRIEPGIVTPNVCRISNTSSDKTPIVPRIAATFVSRPLAN